MTLSRPLTAEELEFLCYKPMEKWESPVNPRRCRAGIYRRGNWRASQCSRAIVLDGFCLQHLAKFFGKRSLPAPEDRPQ